MILSGINPTFAGLSPCKGQVAYALRTRLPVSSIATIPLDLHVLGLPLAFILSQDQTLHCENYYLYYIFFTKSNLPALRLLFIFIILKSSLFAMNAPLFWDCKGNTIFITAMDFLIFY